MRRGYLKGCFEMDCWQLWCVGGQGRWVNCWGSGVKMNDDPHPVILLQNLYGQTMDSFIFLHGLGILPGW